jgi:peptidyl-prolyl cis-trans isomerase D
MLAQFRKGAHGFLAKIMLGFLVLTFALWGVGDVFRSAPENTIATVGDSAISAAELDDSIRNAQAQFPELTADVARSLPVRLQFLDRIINSRLLELEAKSMGLDFSQNALSARIAKEPSFLNDAGQFDRDRFLAIIRQSGMNQSLFLQRFKTDMQIAVLHGAIAESMIVPPELVRLYHHIQNEQREASLVLLSAQDLPKAKAPSDEDLQALYDDVAEQFREPEYRTYRYVYFNSDMVAKSLADGLDEAALRNYYDEFSHEYEGKTFADSKAQIERLLSEQQATDKLMELSNLLDDSIAGGATLEEALKGAELTHLKVETLGPISAGRALKNGELYEMSRVEEEILQTAYGQDTGEISPITISADHYYFLVETLETSPSFVPEFEAVKSDLATLAKDEQAREAVRLKADALASELQEAENPLAAIKERGLRARATGKLSRQSRNVTLGGSTEIAINQAFLKALYELRVNEVSGPVALADGRNAILILKAIHEAKAPDTQALTAIRAELERQFAEQAMGEYLGALREKYGVELMMDTIAAN